ncbi:hypothetical protein [uncultured Cytophaga sp.]|uniref:hypothetical protein n=1 Tax=uncultured Cytophaga sp. TaxID=160238 RepID=UPI0026388619|nr:hypothetical protein [uncultured Cytophaga sp.]
MTQDANEYLIQTNSLQNGVINPVKDGILLNPKEIGRDLIIKDGYYYYLNKKNGIFFKYALTAGKTFQKIDSVSLPNFYENNYSWIGNDTLLLLGIDREDTLVKYAKINVHTCMLNQGTLSIQKPFNAYNSISIGFSNLKKDKLYIGYTYHTTTAESYVTGDTVYVSVLNYATMQVLNTIKDTRSVYPGSQNLIEPASFKTESGDFYYLTCPGVALGNKVEKPTAIFRIKNDSEILDSLYMFNISTSSINNHAYSMYYLGKNKALIRSERKDLYKDWNEHWKVAHYEFFVIDLQKQTVEKLNLPMDKGTRRQCVIIEENIAYISVNSSTEGNYIWMYNTNTGSLTKGLKLTDNANFILRLDPMN